MRALLHFLFATLIVGTSFAAEAPSPQALEALKAVVEGYVDRDETVCAELMVIADGKVVLDTALGDADRAAKRPLVGDSIFCVRSMTKSVVGTAAQMLIDDGALALDDPVSKWIPEFGHDKHASITVRHLLEHSSGLPLSSLITHDMKALRSTAEVAAFAAQATLEFEPGKGFNYSDDGADTLTVIVGKASAAAHGPTSAEAFIKARILEPLGMKDTFCLAPDERARFVTGYVGATGGWTRFWSREDPPLFPCFLGSQGMYSTCADYAKLLRLWASDGMADGKRLLSHAAIERGLAPAHAMGYPTGFAGCAVYYGQLWMTWVAKSSDAPDAKKVVAFGHGGSDGTMAWCWPARDLMVLYFTQSRGGLTPISLEGDIDRLLLGGAENVARDPRELEGFFWDSERNRYVALNVDNGKRSIELPARFVGALVAAPEADQWRLELDPSSIVVVERDAKNAVAAIRLESRGAVARWPKLAVDPSLPSVADVVDMVAKAHGIREDGIPFPIVRTGTLDAPVLNRHLRLRQEFEGFRMRVERTPEQGSIETSVMDGALCAIKVGDLPVQQQAGTMAEQSRLEHPGRLLGDWRKFYRAVQVVARIDDGDAKRLLVRCLGNNIAPMCFLVDEASGRVVGLERIVTIPGVGAIGAVLRLDDFRTITSGDKSVTLAFHAITEFANPRLGTAETRLDTVETPARLDDARFKLE